ncbi:MAG TPA: tRNA lysidine(34) synthetase TilS [Stellaceae bacterium]
MAPCNDTPPLTLDDLSAALTHIGGFEKRPLIAVGTSGGPDSVALTILADRWARSQGGVAWALTVDHGLRPESAGEARQVGVWLRDRRIRHAILTWQGEKPATGLQAAAREARYRLLGEWCRAQGCLHLLVAHHREDQAETFLIRRRAKSGPDGLAAMPVVREAAGYRLVRPLLGVPRDRLRALLVGEGQAWIDDPSNRNLAFERVRLRRDHAGDDVFAEIAEHAAARVERERTLDRLIARHVVLYPAGFATIEPDPVLAAVGDLAERLLARVAVTVGGGAYPPRGERVARLRDGLAAAPARARTLGGCRFVPWRGKVLVMREVAATAPLRLLAGAAAVWDRRFLVPAPAREGLVLGCLGRDGVAALGRERATELPPLVHPALPAFRDGQGCILAVPHMPYWRTAADGLPSIAFRPENPLTRAAFTVV